MNETIQAQRATGPTQFYYGFGSIAIGIKNNLLGTFLLIYYNQVLGLDAIVASLAMFIALCFDAVSDPLIGDMVRSNQDKMGKKASLYVLFYYSILFSLLLYS